MTSTEKRLRRREFLQQSVVGAALTGFTLVPRHVLGGPGHFEQWFAACKTSAPTGTHFGYSGPLTETVLLGTVAYRAGQKLEWDAENLRIANCPEANQYFRREYRKGWKSPMST